jgi:hypothetical protein
MEFKNGLAMISYFCTNDVNYNRLIVLASIRILRPVAVYKNKQSVHKFVLRLPDALPA